jgi:plasmid stabilization system protein ParE
MLTLVVKTILNTARNLSNFPHSGRLVPEIADESIREWFAYSYRVIYRIEEEGITIAAVVHGRRLLDL